MSRHHERVAKQTTVQLPDDLADEAEAVARVRGTSVNALIVDSLSVEVARVRSDNDHARSDKDLVARAHKLLGRDIDEAEHAMLAVAAHEVDKPWLADWLRDRVELP